MLQSPHTDSALSHSLCLAQSSLRCPKTFFNSERDPQDQNAFSGPAGDRIWQNARGHPPQFGCCRPDLRTVVSAQQHNVFVDLGVDKPVSRPHQRDFLLDRYTLMPMRKHRTLQRDSCKRKSAPSSTFTPSQSLAAAPSACLALTILRRPAPVGSEALTFHRGMEASISRLEQRAPAP